jgi:hypothetical protein
MASGINQYLFQVNHLHILISKLIIGQRQMIVKLRRKITLNKTSSFSKEINGATDLRIVNVNVHFVQSRLKASTQRKCEFI